jgi:hypothetical protein
MGRSVEKSSGRHGVEVEPPQATIRRAVKLRRCGAATNPRCGEGITARGRIVGISNTWFCPTYALAGIVTCPVGRRRLPSIRVGTKPTVIL